MAVMDIARGMGFNEYDRPVSDSAKPLYCHIEGHQLAESEKASTLVHEECRYPRNACAVSDAEPHPF